MSSNPLCVAQAETTIQDAKDCPVLKALSVLTGKWKLQILWHLKDSSRRYGELRRLIPEVSEKVLIQQLKQLEFDGLITRQVQSTVPPRVDYSLTPSTYALGPILQTLGDWAQNHLIKASESGVQRTTKSDPFQKSVASS
jgi:DNA-binding HxlR family transcriptional regulator